MSQAERAINGGPCACGTCACVGGHIMASVTGGRRFHWVVDPVGKVRMTQSDKWKVGDKARPAVKRYRAYKDALRELGATLEPGDELHFHIQMPPSWSKKKRAAHAGQPHTQRPDLTNLVGGYEDAVLAEDKGIWCLGATSKRWTTKPSSIIIIRAGSTPANGVAPWEKTNGTE